jgi:hypothetical protein
MRWIRSRFAALTALAAVVMWQICACAAVAAPAAVEPAAGESHACCKSQQEPAETPQGEHSCDECNHHQPGMTGSIAPLQIEPAMLLAILPVPADVSGESAILSHQVLEDIPISPPHDLVRLHCQMTT